MSAAEHEPMETRIAAALERLLTDEVNKLLEALPVQLAPIELGEYSGAEIARASIAIASSQRTEKERVVLLDAYAIEIRYSVFDRGGREAGRLLPYYTACIRKAIRRNGTLGGLVDRIALLETRHEPAGKGFPADHWTGTARLRATAEAEDA